MDGRGRRRGGHRARTGACCLVLLLAAVSSAGAQAPRRPTRLLDAHLHAPEDARAAGIAGGVVHRAEGPVEPPALRDGVRACAGVGAEPDTAALARALASARVRCLKIYLGYVPRWASDPAYTPVYRLAARHRVPVVFHTGDTSSRTARLKYADPLTVDEVAVDHPDVTFVLAHCGNPWYQSAAEVAYKNPNVVLECSALMTGDLDRVGAEARSRYVVEVIRWVFGYLEDPTKLMLGTDWPLVEPEPYVRAYMEAVPEEHWDAVFHDNAARVFGF